jgi:hypothetical protein
LDGVDAEAAPRVGGEGGLGLLAASFVEPKSDGGSDRICQGNGTLFAPFALAPDLGAGSENDVAAVESE